MSKWIPVTLMLLAAANAHALDREQAEKAVEVREAVMTITGWSITPAAAMIKGKIPYEAKQFQTYAERLEAAMSMIPDAFRADTRGFGIKSESLDKVWEENEEFLKLAKDSADASAALAAASASGSLEEVQGPFMDLGKSCKACHDKFREDD